MDYNNPNILNIYQHGSRVYGTASEKSDYDYICIVEDDFFDKEILLEGNHDYHFVSKSYWIKKCKDNNLDFCECYFLPDEYKVKETFVPEFTLKKSKLRSNFSHISSNSFVKCKKKLTVEKDYNPYIGKKSLWHSFRILMFGIQMLETGKIYDYSCANFLYDEIVNNPENDWNYYKEKYQKLYNSYKSKFRSFDQT
ncbi:nucleotidyltransferase domain-containing protein [Thomasclavelia cocleata]|uniref:nucleotidyltransferase domain-containing protein n=1 Tax=Thomasclavelia cocleata TaxID=69824 RepID=UPI00256F2B88|nr:nucleotidyltransferase domain-containing protein [Thomasclavelia cocleata]